MEARATEAQRLAVNLFGGLDLEVSDPVREGLSSLLRGRRLAARAAQAREEPQQEAEAKEAALAYDDAVIATHGPDKAVTNFDVHGNLNPVTTSDAYGGLYSEHADPSETSAAGSGSVLASSSGARPRCAGARCPSRRPGPLQRATRRPRRATSPRSRAARSSPTRCAAPRVPGSTSNRCSMRPCPN